MAEHSPIKNTQTVSNTLKSERYEVFLKRMDILYIKGNLSVRLKILEEWPEAAHYLFGEALIHFDTHGVECEEDRQKREVLEEEAEERRIHLLDILNNLEKRSVDKGILQLEYVENVVKEMGRPLSLAFYSNYIVDKIIPPSPEELEAQKEKAGGVDVNAGAAPSAKETKSSSEIDLTILPEDPMDKIKPINLEPPPGAVPSALSESPAQKEEHASSPELKTEPSVLETEDNEPESLFVSNFAPELQTQKECAPPSTLEEPDTAAEAAKPKSEDSKNDEESSSS